MKVGVIGLGNIAQKAYVPVFASMQDSIEFHLFTRNQTVLNEVASKNGFRHTYESLEELIDSGIERAFVHAATAAHDQILRTLLERGIHVYVDKPVTESYVETEALFQLAEQHGVRLTVGFNRRFAPMVQKLKSISEKNVILIQKDRVQNAYPVRFAVYDLFIHIIDTALYLIDDEIISVQSHLVEEEGILKRVQAMIQTSMTSVWISMNAVAGANQEVMEVQSPAGVARVSDLTDYQVRTSKGIQIESFGDWEGTLEKRGFAPLTRATLTSNVNPVSKQSALLSHQICEQILQQHGF